MRLTGLHPQVRQRAQLALDWANKAGVSVTVTSTRRSAREQGQLYTNYLNGTSRFPANPPGYSAHQYGLAWDSVVAEPYVAWWGTVREAFGFRVPPNDWIHAEVPNWQELV